MSRPTGSNADEWHEFLSEYLDNRATSLNAKAFMAVQIAEALDAAEKRGAVFGTIGRCSSGKTVLEKLTNGYNLMCDALSWFTSHEVEKKLGHLPQWVVMARELTKGEG